MVACHSASPRYVVVRGGFARLQIPANGVHLSREAPRIVVRDYPPAYVTPTPVPRWAKLTVALIASGFAGYLCAALVYWTGS